MAAVTELTAQKKLSITIGYYIAFIALGLVEAALGPTLPQLAENTGTALREISFLFTARSLGYLLGSFTGGRLFDRMPGHVLMTGFIVLMAAMMVAVPMVPLLWLLTLSLFFIGLAQAGIDVGGNTMIVWVHREKVGPFMNGLHFFFGVGAFLSPIIVAQLVLLSGDIVWGYWALALLTLPAVVWLLRLPSPSPETHSEDGQTGRINPWLVALFAVFFFTFVGAEISFGGWIFTYITTFDLANETTAAYMTSAFWGSLTFGRLLSIPIAARVRPRTILTADLIGSVISLGLIVLWPDVLPVVWVGAMGFGFSMASVFPTTISVAERRMPITGNVTGSFLVGASLGGMTLPWIIGQLIETVGPRIIIYTIFGTVLMAVVIFAVLMRYSTRREIPA